MRPLTVATANRYSCDVVDITLLLPRYSQHHISDKAISIGALSVI